MNKTLKILVVFVVMINVAFAEDGVPIQLMKVKIDTSDKASVLRGAKFYANNCMVCHTMKYLQYNKIAKQAGITLDKMPLKQKEWWLGIVPPDLTLIARQYSADWLYTYMHAYYKDAKRPTGYNNLLVKDINMPNIFLVWQGEQILTEQGRQLLQQPGWRKLPYFSVLQLLKQGSMSPQEYDRTMRDLVNFFVYAADPQRTQRELIGFAVLLFLAILFIFAYLLKRVYWHDVKRNDD